MVLARGHGDDERCAILRPRHMGCSVEPQIQAMDSTVVGSTAGERHS